MKWPHSPLPDQIRQPGPAGAPYCMAATRLLDFDVELPANVALHDSLAEAISARGLSGAYVRLRDAEISGLHYVIPGLAPDTRHIAWYSDTYRPEMPGKIIDAGISCGSYGSQPYYHCHGLVADASGTMFMGHLLPETCIPAAPLRATGFGFQGARFSRVFDAETGFELFVAEPAPPAPDADAANGILMRIGPNIEIGAPLIEACRNIGWKRAALHGVGSIIGAHFADGRIMESFATELLITAGQVDLSRPDDARVDLDIALVGLDGAFMQGRLQSGRNPVLITAEIVLQKLPDSP